MNENKNIEEQIEETEREEDKISAKKAGIIIFVTVILAFILLLFFTDTLGALLGKKAETIALVIIAIGLGVYLYRLNRSK